MVQKLSHQQAGRLGEMLALAKLNTLGLAAYTSPEGAPGHDLMVVVGGKVMSIEVKTRQFVKNASEITRWPVDLSTKGDADFFLFIELHIGTLVPTFYLLNNAQAKASHKAYSGSGNCIPLLVRAAVEANDFSAFTDGL
jgi:hypothetical protein